MHTIFSERGKKEIYSVSTILLASSKVRLLPGSTESFPKQRHKGKTTKKFDHHRAICQSLFKQGRGEMKEHKIYDKYIA